jgi:Fe-S-cluster containining protein
MAPSAANLDSFDARIAERVAAFQAARAGWPCRRGCDACCRSLARPLELTRAEWLRVDAAVEALEPVACAQVHVRLAALLGQIARGASGPVVCPYLDESEGACRIYGARPLACRTYGFYASREGAETCVIIDRELSERGAPGAVWGNAEALAEDVERALGPAIPFAEWHDAR